MISSRFLVRKGFYMVVEIFRSVVPLLFGGCSCYFERWQPCPGLARQRGSAARLERMLRSVLVARNATISATEAIPIAGNEFRQSNLSFEGRGTRDDRALCKPVQLQTRVTKTPFSAFSLRTNRIFAEGPELREGPTMPFFRVRTILFRLVLLVISRRARAWLFERHARSRHNLDH